MPKQNKKENWEEYKKHFEANILDGDKIDYCGGAMISPESIWEYLENDLIPIIRQQALQEGKRLERERIRKFIRGEMEQDKSALTCECDGSGSDLSGYCNCGFTRQDTLDDILQFLKDKPKGQNN